MSLRTGNRILTSAKGALSQNHILKCLYMLRVNYTCENFYFYSVSDEEFIFNFPQYSIMNFSKWCRYG